MLRVKQDMSRAKLPKARKDCLSSGPRVFDSRQNADSQQPWNPKGAEPGCHQTQQRDSITKLIFIIN